MIRMPRTLSLPDGDVSMLPPVAHYDCLRVESPLVIDGRLDEAVWARVEWSGAFVKMDTGAPVSLKSQIALLWDDVALYAGFRFEDGDIWGTHVEHHDHVYHRDSDAELFIHGEGVYYEIGINPINTVYEVLWTWLEPVVARQDVNAESAALHRAWIVFHPTSHGPHRTIWRNRLAVARIAPWCSRARTLEQSETPRRRVDGRIGVALEGAPHPGARGWAAKSG